MGGTGISPLARTARQVALGRTVVRAGKRARSSEVNVVSSHKPRGQPVMVMQTPPNIEDAVTTAIVVNAGSSLNQRKHLRRRLSKCSALVLSAAAHLCVVLVMASFVLPALVFRELELNAVFDVGEGPELYEFVMQDDAPLQMPIELDSSASDPESTFEFPVPDIALVRPDMSTWTVPLRLSSSVLSPRKAATSVRVASSVEDAVDRITGSIQGRLRGGDLLVVWLLDASLSLADDRQQMALQMAPILDNLAGRTDAEHQLFHTVVSFGATVKERVAPTGQSAPVLAAIQDIPVDPSGKEKVFTAVQQSVAHYREKWREKQLMVVVWTDESGDDADQLANTLQSSQAHAATVSVVGPSAVLGGETGIHFYVDPVSQQKLQLPVSRGPDSALPERLELAYWFLTTEPQDPTGLASGFGHTDLPAWYGNDASDVAGHSCIAATESGLPSWYGGADLAGLASGFSPYALTRLASETNGEYILLDRPEDGGPFHTHEMLDYQPDYRSTETYLRDVQSHPLRSAVRDAVQVTLHKKLGPPPTMLFGMWSDTPPYGFMRHYFTPARFARQYRVMRLELKSQAERTQRFVERALDQVSQPDDPTIGLEAEYEREESPRWRAWYDLTRGRLLATSVRLEEYRLACDRVCQRGFLDTTTNHVVFVPSLKLRSSERFQRRAAEAERLLVRCVRQHPRTPWAYLAQRELAYGLGIDATQHTLSQVVMPWVATQRPDLPKF